MTCCSARTRIPDSDQTVVVLYLYCCLLRRKATNTNFKFVHFTWNRAHHLPYLRLSYLSLYHLGGLAIKYIVAWMHTFPLISVWFIYQNLSKSYELWNNTRIYEMLHTLNLGCSFTTFRSRTKINDLDVVLHGSFIPPTSELSARIRVQLFNRCPRIIVV